MGRLERQSDLLDSPPGKYERPGVETGKPDLSYRQAWARG
jgi:hypothetical protein